MLTNTNFAANFKTNRTFKFENSEFMKKNSITVWFSIKYSPFLVRLALLAYQARKILPRTRLVVEIRKNHQHQSEIQKKYWKKKIKITNQLAIHTAAMKGLLNKIRCTDSCHSTTTTYWWYFSMNWVNCRSFPWAVTCYLSHIWRICEHWRI